MPSYEQTKCDPHGVIMGTFTLDKSIMPKTVKVGSHNAPNEKFHQDLGGQLGLMVALVYPEAYLQDFSGKPKVEEGFQNA